jgi:hypothetical protein
LEEEAANVGVVSLVHLAHAWRSDFHLVRVFVRGVDIQIQVVFVKGILGVPFQPGKAVQKDASPVTQIGCSVCSCNDISFAFVEEDPLLRQLRDFGFGDGLEGLRERPDGCHDALRVMDEIRILMLGREMVMMVMVERCE